MVFWLSAMADNLEQEVREIYRQHGWPDAFRQDECCEALKEWYHSR
jgi:hypothetical protein